MFALEIFIGLSKKVQHEPFTADTAGDKQLRRQGKDLNHPLKEEKTTQLCYILERVRNKDRRDTVYNFPDLVAFRHSLFFVLLHNRVLS